MPRVAVDLDGGAIALDRHASAPFDVSGAPYADIPTDSASNADT